MSDVTPEHLAAIRRIAARNDGGFHRDVVLKLCDHIDAQARDLDQSRRVLASVEWSGYNGEENCCPYCWAQETVWDLDESAWVQGSHDPDCELATSLSTMKADVIDHAVTLENLVLVGDLTQEDVDRLNAAVKKSAKRLVRRLKRGAHRLPGGESK